VILIRYLSVDYDPIDHLNALFSHPSSLSTVSVVTSSLQRYQDELDSDIASLVEAQTASNAGSVRRMQEAKEELGELFAKIENVQRRALETERTITEMTADIKKLDSTKKNLTLSMTALKRLQMLTAAYEQLRGLSQSRQYRECAHLLQAVIQLMAHFKSYRSIDQIAALSKSVADLQRELLEQICEDFEVTFAKSEIPQKRVMLGEACQVLDSLGDHARARLITWYCNTQLREYRQVFRGNDEAGSLDNIGRRYSWFNRMLKSYDAEHAPLFPASWKVNEMLANSFCESTRDDYKSILQKSMRRTDGQPPDVNLLLSCLQETLDFEQSLEQRFSVGNSRSSIDSVVSTADEKRTGFSQAISEAFEPYLSIWVESQDRQLSLTIPRYRSQPLRNPEEEFHSQMVIPSSTELFHSYRVTLAQCAKLSTGARLLDLSRTFAKYLDAYAQQVLTSSLMARSVGGISIEDSIIILNTADYCYQTSLQLEEKIKSRIDADLRPQVDLQSPADAFLGVASTAIRSLVHRTEVDCEPAWREMRSISWGKLDSVGDQSGFVAILLSRVKDKARETLRYLQKPQYARAYCDNLVDALVTTYVHNIVACRPVSESGAEQMLLDSYVLKQGLASIPTLNAESDGDDHKAGSNTQAQLPSAATTAFVKRINLATTKKLDPLLKTLQVRASPSQGLVQAYLIHIRDRSEPNFRKVLELKGLVRKQDQAHLVELFNAHKASPTNEGLPLSNPLITGLQLLSTTPAQGQTPLLGVLKDGGSNSAGGTIGTAGNAGIGISGLNSSTPSLPTRFDPSHFGTALINAARDAGDRLTATSTLSPVNAGINGLSAGDSGASSINRSATLSPALSVGGAGVHDGEGGGAATPSLNENLRNLGKFFRRGTEGAGVGGGAFGGLGRKD
jgi:hypothetical protein